MRKILLVLFLALLLPVSTQAMVVLDFENVPQDYWYAGGGQNLGNYYSGVTFGTNANILETQVYHYNSSGYPPHSGYAVLEDLGNNGVRADFANPANHVEVWYTSYYGFYLEAYDASHNLLTSDSGLANYGSNSLLKVDSMSFNIAYVIMHDSANYYTLDDFGFNSVNPVPVPPSVWLFGSGLLGLAGWRRFRKG